MEELNLPVLTPAIWSLARYRIVDDRPPEPPRPAGFDEWLAAVRQARLLGVATLAFRDGDLPLDDHQVGALEHAATATAAVELELDALAVRIATDLGELGPIVVKGPAHTYGDFEVPELRSYGDLDLLLDPDAEVDRLVDRLPGRWTRVFPAFAPRWSREFAKGVTLTDGRIELDVHRHLSQGLALGIDPDELRGHVATVRIADTDVPVLDPATRLVHTAIHLAGGGPIAPLAGLRDVVVMARDEGRVTDAVSLARRWDVTGALGLALRGAHRCLGGLSWSVQELAAGLGPSRNEGLRLRILRSSAYSFRGNVAAGLLGVRGVRARLDYVRGLRDR